ncbi:MAG: hypothetical protein ACKVP4_03675 [Hyphomicrobium sp.]
MRAQFNVLFAAAAMVGALAASVHPATAGCTRLGFSVNDYGKDGPTNDAKALLDKYIEKKMAERGVKTYRVGKKDVNCELFLNFIVFDEHTCRADATVCWDDVAAPKVQGAAVPSLAPAPTAAAPKPTEAAKSQEAPAAPSTTTGSIEKPEAANVEAPTPVAEPVSSETPAPAAATEPIVPEPLAPMAAETVPAAPVEASAPDESAPVDSVQP